MKIKITFFYATENASVIVFTLIIARRKGEGRGVYSMRIECQILARADYTDSNGGQSN